MGLSRLKEVDLEEIAELQAVDSKEIAEPLNDQSERLLIAVEEAGFSPHEVTILLRGDPEAVRQGIDRVRERIKKGIIDRATKELRAHELECLADQMKEVERLVVVFDESAVNLNEIIEGGKVNIDASKKIETTLSREDLLRLNNARVISIIVNDYRQGAAWLPFKFLSMITKEGIELQFSMMSAVKKICIYPNKDQMNLFISNNPRKHAGI